MGHTGFLPCGSENGPDSPKKMDLGSPPRWSNPTAEAWYLQRSLDLHQKPVTSWRCLVTFCHESNQPKPITERFGWWFNGDLMVILWWFNGGLMVFNGDRFWWFTWWFYGDKNAEWLPGFRMWELWWFYPDLWWMVISCGWHFDSMFI